MMNRIDLKRVKALQSGTRWDLGNEVLYRLCSEYPKHVDEQVVLAKIWLIGRSYSVAIERRRKFREINGEAFYAAVVGPKILRAPVDEWLTPLYSYKRPTEKNSSEIIAAHSKLTNLFARITGLEKRSLASKYLHFHLPNLFYIYDARAVTAISSMTSRLKQLPTLREHDAVYSKFFFRAKDLVEWIEQEHGYYLSPRKLDDYLLELS